MNVRRILTRLGIRVAEERRGELWARCPNTSHESESEEKWSINGKTGKHSCFSCGFGGSIQSLVATLLGFGGDWDGGAIQAAEWLAGEAEAEPKRELPPGFEVESTVGARIPFRLPGGVVVAPVASWPEPPRQYLVGYGEKERGIPEEQVDRWGFGYAAGGRLSGRIVVVVRDQYGTPSNYMARSFLGAGGKKKYLFPSKEEGADFDVVFGEEHWPRQVADRGTVLVAEGALKALALERAAGLPVAALGGSRVRPLHALKLSTFERVVYVRDGGSAGEEAWLDVRANLGRHAGLSCVDLPPGEDADSLAKKDQGALRDALAPHLRHL
jgi:DNA primase